MDGGKEARSDDGEATEAFDAVEQSQDDGQASGRAGERAGEAGAGASSEHAGGATAARGHAQDAPDEGAVGGAEG